MSRHDCETRRPRRFGLSHAAFSLIVVANVASTIAMLIAA
jgi:hypothetical protein